MSKNKEYKDQQISQSQEQEESEETEEVSDSQSEESSQEVVKKPGPRAKSKQIKKKIKKQMKKVMKSKGKSKKSKKKKKKKKMQKPKKMSWKRKREARQRSDSQQEEQQVQNTNIKRVMKDPPPMNPPWLHKRLRGALYDPQQADQEQLIEKAHIDDSVLDETMQVILDNIVKQIKQKPLNSRKPKGRFNDFLDIKTFEQTHYPPTAEDQNLLEKYQQNCRRGQKLYFNREKKQDDSNKNQIKRSESEVKQSQNLQNCPSEINFVDLDQDSGTIGEQISKIQTKYGQLKNKNPILVKPSIKLNQSEDSKKEQSYEQQIPKIRKYPITNSTNKRPSQSGFEDLSTRLTSFYNHKRTTFPLQLSQPKLKILSKTDQISIVNKSIHGQYKNTHLLRKVTSPNGKITNVQIIDLDDDGPQNDITGVQDGKKK